jgi:Fe2+ or Zn2+ uptake regulation protein
MPPSSKLRMTKQRRVILDELKGDDTHLTADRLYERVRRRLPRISLGTVYRNLEVLSELGIIRKLSMADTASRFDGCADGHLHIRCVRCGRIDDVPPVEAAFAEEDVGKATGYRVMGHQLEFWGVCPGCMAEGKT